MDANVATPAVATPAPAEATPTAEDQALAVIAGVGKPSVPNVAPVVPEPRPTPQTNAEPTPAVPPIAPVPTGQEPVQPAAGTAPEGGATTPTDPDGDTSGEAPAEGTPALDEATLVDNVLGLPPETVETTDILRGKAEAAQREVGRLEAEREAQLESLKEQGLALVHVGDGKYQLAPTDEYRSNFDIDKDVDISKLIEPMSEEQRDAMLTDPEKTFAKLAKGIAKKVGLELLTKRPPVKEAKASALLTEYEQSDCYNSFVGSKHPDGNTPLYPNANDADIKGYMARVWNANTPAMIALREGASRDKGLYMAAMETCYYKAAFGVSEAKKRIALAQTQASAETTANQNQVQISAGSAGAPPAAAPVAAVGTLEDQALSVIGSARPA